MKNGETVKFIDLCAGLGGFHHGIELAQSRNEQSNVRFECVLASELDRRLRELYVQNFGEAFCESYKKYHPPELALEAYESLKSTSPTLCDGLNVYAGEKLECVHGDLNSLVTDEGLRKYSNGQTIIPEHDLLVAGFPCQPFSKSGYQLGFSDKTRGTIFHLIHLILKEKQPKYVLLENVGNFERHDGGKTWQTVKEILEDLGYSVDATLHVGNGGKGLLSPHDCGQPHHRARFFIAGQLEGKLKGRAFKASDKLFPTERNFFFSLQHELSHTVGQSKDVLEEILSSEAPVESPPSVSMTKSQFDCIDQWQSLLTMLEAQDIELEGKNQPTRWRSAMPSFPIWGYELDPWNWYPIEENPKGLILKPKILLRERDQLLEQFFSDVDAERKSLGLSGDIRSHPPQEDRAYLDKMTSWKKQLIDKWIKSWPGYAGKRDTWPSWKKKFLKQNRYSLALRLWGCLDLQQLRGWLDTLYSRVPAASYQKLEWNCKEESLKLENHILQFRPSGLRVKRRVNVPALVAMTTTQIPVVHDDKLSHKWRYIYPYEALQLQGFPASWKHPKSLDDAYKAFGNAVHAEVISRIFSHWIKWNI